MDFVFVHYATPSPPPVLNRQYQNRYNTNQNQMENTYLFYIVKICKIQSPDLLFLFVFMSFYISRYKNFNFNFQNFIISIFSQEIFVFNRLTQVANQPGKQLQQTQQAALGQLEKNRVACMTVVQQKHNSQLYKGASTKNFCHAQQILAVKGVGVGGGLRQSVKNGKFVTKIFFSDNVE